MGFNIIFFCDLIDPDGFRVYLCPYKFAIANRQSKHAVGNCNAADAIAILRDQAGSGI